jgi:hypothetical protein
MKNNPMQSRIRPTVAVVWIARPLHERVAAGHDPGPDADWNALKIRVKTIA